MKRKIFSVLSICFLFSTVIFAQPAYYSVLTNPSQPAPNQYEFDVLIKFTRLDSTFELTAYQLGLVIDNTVWNGGTASASLIPGSSDMVATIVPQNINVASNMPGDPTKRNIKVAARLAQPGQGQIMPPDSMKRYIRIRLQTSAASLVGLPANLGWEFKSYKTVIAYNRNGISTAFTNPASHFVDLGGAALAVLSPNGGENWAVGSSQNITWSASAAVANLNIDYTTNNGTSWLPVATNVPKTPTSYSWTIPNTPSTQCKVRITDAANPALTDMSDAVFTIGTGQVCKDVIVAADWNIVSVPVLASNMTKTSLFPKATSSAYAYNNGYITVDTLKNSVGYWLKFDSARTVSICGTPIPVLTIPVVTGWNLIGIYDKNVLVSGITSTPPGIIAGSFYEYNNGYNNPTTLNFGKGFWIKTSGAGVLNLPSGFAKNDNREVPERVIDADWKRITITDNAGKTYTLYSSGKSIESAVYELPPVPPSFVFDVRYSTDKIVEDISTGRTINIQGAEYPVKIKVEGMDINVKDNVNGKIFNQVLKNCSEISISNPAMNSISVAKVEIPKDFMLSQNYPNPFNPTSTIKFGLPEKADVTLNVYNAVGELVATLAKGEFDAGYHSVEFSGKSLSSGVYIYQLQAGNFKSVKKMLLVK